MAAVGEPKAAGCSDPPAWGFGVGILMGVLGSIGMNIGQNLQASGLQSLPETERFKPMRSKLWKVGFAVFLSFALMNFSALALAPGSVLIPLESIQFVTNVAWNRLINHKLVSQRMLVGVSSAVVGTVLSVTFGAQPSGCHSLRDLENFWKPAEWWLYLTSTFVLAAVAHAFHERCEQRELRGELLPRGHSALMPVAYTLSSALAGGAQMIVHSKVVSELLSMLLQGDTSVLYSWIFYLELLLLATCGLIWAWRLTACLILCACLMPATFFVCAPSLTTPSLRPATYVTSPSAVVCQTTLWLSYHLWWAHTFSLAGWPAASTLKSSAPCTKGQPAPAAGCSTCWACFWSS